MAHESLDLPGDDGLSLTVYDAAPDTPTADSLKLLAGWAAPQGQGLSSAQADTER